MTMPTHSFSLPDQMSDKELVVEKGNHMICDVESYRNYFCMCFESVETGKRAYFEGNGYNVNKLLWLMNNTTIVTFNGMAYDIHMIILSIICGEYTEENMWDITRELIELGTRPSKLYQTHGANPKECGEIDHIDIINVAFGKASLKLYAGRLHAKHMQDLPYPPGSTLTEEMKANVLTYCFNDISNTRLLFEELKKQIELRKEMSTEYGTDLRSKSDAQIAETVITSEIYKRTGRRLKRANIEPGTKYQYNVPGFISFQTEQFKNMLDNVRNLEFIVDDKGSVKVPEYFKKLALSLGDSVYKMGVGGVHSSEQCESHISDEQYVYIDKDVAAYYPRIILNTKIYPKNMGEVFLEIYESIVERRIEAKRTKDKTTDASLKIVINGSFGKLGSKWSVLYAPDLLIQVTVTGQLSILMLIERLEVAGFSVVSANTDGFITKVNRSRENEYQAICSQWEDETRFELEDTIYKAVYSRDVNNYIALTADYTKVKGCYRPADISKNPAGDIIYEAIVEELKTGKPVKETIMECRDISKFVFVKTVNGGAKKDGDHVGKVVRWYHQKGNYTPLRYSTNGNKVPGSAGGKPIMYMDDEFPDDIDYAFYIGEASKGLASHFSQPKQLTMF